MRLIILLFPLLLCVSCGDGNVNKSAMVNGPTPFQVVSIPTQDITSYTTYPASIEGIIYSEVRAKISGYITDVLVDEGQRVRKGETLFKLETQALSQDAAAAAANVNAAQVEVDKLKPLVEKDIISNVQLETAKAKLQQAQSSYNSINANINYGLIKSPVDGFVGSIRFRRGALVSPTNQQALTSVADISEVFAYFSMNEKDYLDFIQDAEGDNIVDKIKNLPKVKLILANGRVYDQEGIIETINSQVDEATGAITFRAKFDNPSRILSNGNSAKIQLPKVFKDVVVIPKESTYERQGNTYAYKVGKDSMAISTALTILTEVDNLYLVENGLNADDEIVAKGIDKIRGDMKIIPKSVPFDSIAKPIQKVFR
ncbi:efflux RND transporter periplasmic adaptor subunit [Maribacter sp. ACAM166]|uniref:efflux RND transporter periplasmic adaptor subunit n=1 Tax=Maribacter sp. ACAM166 TaxID=2508996 RepID=UPI0010FF1CEE|nr:efflux RND transporter periplasmic adaptor subunit [Maribacter sp. ACAM166]TLP80934.1 efflux RND transporter periplasmic adaptor subunit [Maribacter sp. ACAM166]